MVHHYIPCNDSENIFLLSQLCINGSHKELECVPHSGHIDSDQKEYNATYGLRIAVGIWCVLVSLVGIFGNLLTLFALPHAYTIKHGNKTCCKTWNTSTVFIINLARIDLFYCVFCMPTFIIPFLTQKWGLESVMPCYGK